MELHLNALMLPMYIQGQELFTLRDQVEIIAGAQVDHSGGGGFTILNFSGPSSD